MKRIISILVLSLLPQLSQSAVCFDQGNYSGFGMFKDSGGNLRTYEHRAYVKSSTQVENHFKWPEQEVRLSYEIRGDQVFVNHSSAPSGSIECRFGSTLLKLSDSSTRLIEEWISVGNYLLVSGEKTVSGQTIKYVELLIQDGNVEL
ncbi:MAG: hypothetical protein IPK04_12440 [Bdellovibrionales bacterium]|jgi:hypothetical protein|nr:hypothetical protein [Bdellovibrionales bacterium]